MLNGIQNRTIAEIVAQDTADPRNRTPAEINRLPLSSADLSPGKITNTNVFRAPTVTAA